MFKSTSLGLAMLLMAGSAAVSAEPLANVGRTATPKELAAWDIDVRADFKGLPVGSGSVQKGQQVWEGKCASCHGTFAESNQVFTPIVGGTTREDMKTGHVAALTSNSQPQRTTLMKVATVSTLWDYIHRAMPWTAPKSLNTEEVYAVTAYILNLAEIVPDDFVLSNANIADVQKTMPNRNGMTREHGLWKVNGKPDVKNVACMKNCDTSGSVSSALPDSARNSHGDLAEQNRTFGAVRGVSTAPRPAAGTAPAAAVPSDAPHGAKTGGLALATQYSCVACHGVANKIVGPGFNEVAAKYKGNPEAEAQLISKVSNGGSGNWGAIPMPAQKQVKEEDIKTMVEWILKGAK